MAIKQQDPNPGQHTTLLGADLTLTDLDRPGDAHGFSGPVAKPGDPTNSHQLAHQEN